MIFIVFRQFCFWFPLKNIKIKIVSQQQNRRNLLNFNKKKIFFLSSMLQELFYCSLIANREFQHLVLKDVNIIFSLVKFRVQFSNMIMFSFRIAITTEGKYAALSAIDRLVDLVSDEISEVRLNSLKVSDFLFLTQF